MDISEMQQNSNINQHTLKEIPIVDLVVFCLIR